MLSQNQIGLLQNVYLRWNTGLGTDFVLPRIYQQELLECTWINQSFRELIQSWWDKELPEFSPFDINEPENLDPLLKGTIGGFMMWNLQDAKKSNEISLDTVKAAIIDRVLFYFIKIITEDIPVRSESSPVMDLYWTLRFPEKSKLTFVGQWALGCVYQNRIKPKFGGIESFARVVGLLAESSEGHGKLVTWNFSFNLLAELFSADHPIIKIAEILLCLENHSKTSLLGLEFEQHLLDNGENWRMVEANKWGPEDRAKANIILKEFDAHRVSRRI